MQVSSPFISPEYIFHIFLSVVKKCNIFQMSMQRKAESLQRLGKYIRRIIARANVGTEGNATKNAKWFGTKTCANAFATKKKSVRADSNGFLLFAGKQNANLKYFSLYFIFSVY